MTPVGHWMAAVTVGQVKGAMGIEITISCQLHKEDAMAEAGFT